MNTIKGPTLKRYILQGNPEELKTMFFQLQLENYSAVREGIDKLELIGEGASYLDLMNESGEELDSNSGNAPNVDTENMIIVIDERGDSFNIEIPEDQPLNTSTNVAGLLNNVKVNGDDNSVAFIPKSDTSYTCKLMLNGEYVNSDFIKQTYEDFLNFISANQDSIAFNAIYKSIYYEEDYNYGDKIHNILLGYKGCDFPTSAFSIFEDEDFMKLSLNPDLSDNLAVNLFKRALNMINAGEGPYEEWNDSEKREAQLGEKIRNNLLGNPSFYRNRNSVFEDMDVISWFIEKNLNLDTLSAILKNEELELSHLNSIEFKNYDYYELITQHPKYVNEPSEYKLSTSRTTIVEDVAGDIDMDSFIELFMDGHETWDETIFESFYDFDNLWHEYGALGAVDELITPDNKVVPLDGKVDDFSQEPEPAFNHSNASEFFICRTKSIETGVFEYGPFTLSKPFDINKLQPEPNLDCPNMISYYSYDCEVDEVGEISGELVQGSGKGIESQLYLVTDSELIEVTHTLEEIREAIKNKGLAPNNREDLKSFLETDLIKLLQST